jgi:hypothetical protein
MKVKKKLKRTAKKLPTQSGKAANWAWQNGGEDTAKFVLIRGLQFLVLKRVA